MNLPNWLTLSRIVFAFIFVFFIIQNSLFSTVLAALVFTVASLTDFWDGYFAKKQNLISDFGKIMDPIADKVLILTAFMIFVQLGVVQFWMVAVIFLREIIVTVSRLLAVRHGRVIAAEKSGKLKTVFQIGSIFVILAFLILERTSFSSGHAYKAEGVFLSIINFLMLVTVFLTLISGIFYFRNKRKMAHA